MFCEDACINRKHPAAHIAMTWYDMAQSCSSLTHYQGAQTHYSQFLNECIRNRLQLLEWGRQTGKHWRTSLDDNMLRNKDILDHSCNCKLRQQGQVAAEGPRCIPQAGGLPLLVTVTTGEYKAQVTEHCPAAGKLNMARMEFAVKVCMGC